MVDKNRREFMKKFGVGFSAALFSLPFVNALQNINFSDGSKSMKVIEGSSDPTISTNPGEVGVYYFNTTTGELFGCTDATPGSNIWKSVGVGTQTIEPYVFQGSSYGYYMGGRNAGVHNEIGRFSFTSDGNGVDVGDLTVARDVTAGTRSNTNGYCAGGYNGGDYNTIDKFSFSSDGNATDVGDLTQARRHSCAQSSTTHGYTTMGENPIYNIIDKFSFSSDGNATDVGDSHVSRYISAGTQN